LSDVIDSLCDKLDKTEEHEEYQDAKDIIQKAQNVADIANKINQKDIDSKLNDLSKNKGIHILTTQNANSVAT
jgi:hypothetical protein